MFFSSKSFFSFSWLRFLPSFIRIWKHFLQISLFLKIHFAKFIWLKIWIPFLLQQKTQMELGFLCFSLCLAKSEIANRILDNLSKRIFKLGKIILNFFAMSQICLNFIFMKNYFSSSWAKPWELFSLNHNSLEILA